ncbi:bifunctional diguanylate cyclase/phosphodiesterase [Ideonella sp.]|uniref:bifunctional diguanylate cyclase/phosphodiesterase n=1 Tax=Ideonella sp. TaxID=1929293 RepID=UPI002B4A8A28|nr:EAL domain-containing protein [Ideonella sp.]HJV69317.1 EAL domain-containing protein [Ideonella sp.]
MSLIRQVWLLLALTLLLAFAAAFGITVHSARQVLETQLTLKNNDTAQFLAMSLSQQKGDPTARELVVAGQFDTGFYELIRLTGTDGKVLLERRADPKPSTAPGWFVTWLGITPATGTAPVSDGWKPVGRLEVRSHSSFAHDQLWHSTLSTATVLALLALALGGLAAVGVRRIRLPLEATVQQAAAITERRFATISEPVIPELRDVTRAMNTMVVRLKGMFDEQAAQVEQLRRQANCDALTGLSNRAHFMGRVKVMLNSEDGSAGGAIVLVRLVDLQGLNRKLGHTATDRLLQESAAAIVESARRAGSFEVGRLNGSDFAMVLPDVGSLREPAVDVAARLRNLLRAHDAAANAVVGAVRWWHGAPMSSLLAAADQALARAEARGAYAVELDDTGDGLVLGEDTWRERLQGAVSAQRAKLVEFPLVDMRGAVLHRECPLRLQLEDGGEMVPAAQWLPMARRTQLTARIDLLAAKLALAAIAADGMARAVNVSPGSLQDSSFVPNLRGLLSGYPGEAPGLWLEVAEEGALRHIELVRELVNQMHTLGARVGLEHAGERLTEASGLLEVGLDFVKLDASFVEGLSADHARRDHVAGAVRMLHSIGLKVYAEGVTSSDDATALDSCGLDGITGPVVPPG